MQVSCVSVRGGGFALRLVLPAPARVCDWVYLGLGLLTLGFLLACSSLWAVFRSPLYFSVPGNAWHTVGIHYLLLEQTNGAK